MIICSNCHAQLQDGIVFCPRCGAPLQVAPTYAQPVYQQPIYVEPVEPKPSIARAIVAIALSGFAITMATVCLIYSMLFVALGEPLGGFIFSIVFSVYTLPGSIVGMVLACGYLDSNATRLKPMAKAAKILGIISLALTAFMLLYGFFCII